MWLMCFTLACALFAVTPSPFMGLILLLLLSLGLAILQGLLISPWLFLVIILVYVGGVMIMFVYLTGLISEFKTVSVTPRMSVFLVSATLIPSYLTFSELSGTLVSVWLSQGLDGAALGLIVYSVLYLLMALVVVLLIAGKLQGPLKQ